jgi:hypothetical protein
MFSVESWNPNNVSEIFSTAKKNAQNIYYAQYKAIIYYIYRHDNGTDQMTREEKMKYYHCILN